MCLSTIDVVPAVHETGFKFFTSIHFHALKTNKDYQQMYLSLILVTSSTAHFYKGFSVFITSPKLTNEFAGHLQKESFNCMDRAKCYKIQIDSYLNKMKISLDD
jgi:hypothetical protein